MAFVTTKWRNYSATSLRFAAAGMGYAVLAADYDVGQTLSTTDRVTVQWPTTSDVTKLHDVPTSPTVEVRAGQVGLAGSHSDFISNTPPAATPRSRSVRIESSHRKQRSLKGKSMLTGDEIERFDRDGYLVFPRLLNEPKRRKYFSVFEELVEKAKSLKTNRPPTWLLEVDAEGNPVTGVLHKVQGVGVVDFRALDMAQEPEIVSRIESLIGPQMAIFGAKFFPKLAGGGTSVHWHQDNFYFKTESDQIISCGIYLEDADQANGCLGVIPGSHKQGVTHHERSGLVEAKGYKAEIYESKAVDVVCPGGTVVLFSANLMHGTNEGFPLKVCK